jgi:predicted nucleic acid-binding protein
MKREVLDTSVLLRHWHDRGGASIRGKTPADTRAWAEDLIVLRDTDAVVTPVYLEVICGVTSAHELKLTRAYLAPFRAVDQGKIIPQDWVEARRLAERIPRDGHRRQLGDCLIRAIANRLHYEVISFDDSFPG